MSIWETKNLSFGFVSTRFSGTDGVSLETQKWVDVLRSKGAKVFFMAGNLDTDPDISFLEEKAYFKHDDILKIQHELFKKKRRSRKITQFIHKIKEELKDALEKFHKRFKFDILVVQNALAIPVNIPLGLALAEFIIETEIPTIAHHHDFYWERQRFHSFAAMDYFRSSFPPIHSCVQHVVINSIAGETLSRRTGASWTLIPNVMDFKNLPQGLDDYNMDLRKQIGLDKDSLMVLQPTRVVSRKGIETAIELVSRLSLKNSALVIPHEAGDEGFAYQQRVKDYAKFMGVNLKIISNRIAKKRGKDTGGQKLYTLWDVYPHADLITYPSVYEGYGNAFVEAIYFKKPVLVNRYAIFEADIEPKGFDAIVIDNFITDETINNVKKTLKEPERLAVMAETNYMLGWRYLSYEMLEEKIETLLTNIYGS